MKKIICVTNVGLDDPGGRAWALKSRFEMLERHDWVIEPLIIKQHHKVFSKTLDLKRKIKNENYRIVWSMNNPLTLHLPPLILKSRCNFKWIAEFRDPIYLNPDQKKLRMFYRIAEREIVSKCDAAVLCMGIQADKIDYLRLYRKELEDKLFILPFFGFRKEECNSSPEYNPQPPFTITYAGSFYQGWIEPFSFLKGFKRFLDEVSLAADDIRLQFIGDWRKEYSECVAKLGIQDYVAVSGWLRKEEVIPLLAKSHLLLYIGGSKEENRKNVSLKFWDSLCYIRPIFAITGINYTINEIILKNQFGYVASYDSPRDISEKIFQAYTDFNSGRVYGLLKRISYNRNKFIRDMHDEEFVKVCENELSKIK